MPKTSKTKSRATAKKNTIAKKKGVASKKNTAVKKTGTVPKKNTKTNVTKKPVSNKNTAQKSIKIVEIEKKPIVRDLKEKENKIKTKKINLADVLLLILFLAIITIPLIYFPIKHILISTGKESLFLTDNWQYYESKGNKYLDFVESAKLNLNNRVNNYFPYYSKLTSYYYQNNYQLNKLIDKNKTITGKSHDGELIIYDDVNNFYYTTSKYDDENLNKRFLKNLAFFNELAKSNNNISLNIYMPLRYELTKLGDRNLYAYVQEFKNNLDSKVNFDYLEIDSLEEYLNYFYKTDHHWNAYGSFQGLKEIKKLMNLDIDIKHNIKNVTVHGQEIKLYGSMAKSVMSTKVSDTLTDIVAVDRCKATSLNNYSISKFKPRTLEISTNPYYDYYVGYYNGQYGSIKYSCKKFSETQRNLLIFSDSMSWPIDYKLADAFDNTYNINLRYDEYINNNFDYQEFIKNYKITDVLFLYEGVSILFDEFNYNIAERIDF